LNSTVDVYVKPGHYERTAWSVAIRERRRRDLFNKKRSRKELSRRLLSIDFSLVGGQDDRREEDESDEDDDIYPGYNSLNIS